jgi:hypothetical protein
MKIFFYKSILIFTLFILSVHFSFSIITKKLKSQYSHFISEEGIRALKIKIREELKNGSEKDILINPDDALLINKFLKKIKSDLEQNQ